MRRSNRTMRRQQDQLYELSNLILNILRSPNTPFEFSDQSPAPARITNQQISPAGFACLLFGISIALMLCGSVTFFIGFFMMPWILGLVMVLYVVGVVSTLSMIGKAIFCCPFMMLLSSSDSTPKDHATFGQECIFPWKWM